jgi:hypothetical protein
MNKSVGGNLKLNSQVNGKITTYTPSDFRFVLKIILKKGKDQPLDVFVI